MFSHNQAPSFLILDVDGVLTDGTYLYSKEGKIYKQFGPHDHDGIRLIQRHLPVVFVTADERGFPITQKRIKEDMKQNLFLVKEQERFKYLTHHYELANSIYMGDGLHDAKILRLCRYGIAPANARVEAKAAARFVTSSKGGEGAVLDACLKILELFFPDEFEKLKQDL